MFSFTVRLFEKLFIDCIRKSPLKKFGFYFIFYHNRIHFLLFNMFLAGGVFLNTRTILHMVAWPDNLFMKIDKIVAIIVFFYYWSDIIELYNSSLTPPPMKKHDKTKIKIRNGYKKVLEKYKKQVKSQSSQFDGVDMDRSNMNLKALESDEKYTKGQDDDTHIKRVQLPYQVPKAWIKEEEAASLKYKKKYFELYDFEKAEYNVAMVEFSMSNINSPIYMMIHPLRLEGIILRSRYVVYQIMIISLNQLAFIVAPFIFFFEIGHISVYLYYAIKLRYVKSWMLLYSKVNIGLAIIGIAGLVILIYPGQTDKLALKQVNTYYQLLGLLVFAISIITEVILLLIRLVMVLVMTVLYII